MTRRLVGVVDACERRVHPVTIDALVQLRIALAVRQGRGRRPALHPSRVETPGVPACTGCLDSGPGPIVTTVT
jgi:hypothetical protein